MQRNNAAFTPMSNLLKFNPEITLLYIGGNDFLGQMYSKGTFSASDRTTFYSNISGIIDRLRIVNSNMIIIVLGYYDLFDGFSTNLSNPALNSNSSISILARLSEESKTVNDGLHTLVTQKRCESLVNEVYTAFMRHAYGRFLGDTQAGTFYMRGSDLSGFNIHPAEGGGVVPLNTCRRNN